MGNLYLCGAAKQDLYYCETFMFESIVHDSNRYEIYKGEKTLSEGTYVQLGTSATGDVDTDMYSMFRMNFWFDHELAKQIDKGSIHLEASLFMSKDAADNKYPLRFGNTTYYHTYTRNGIYYGANIDEPHTIRKIYDLDDPNRSIGYEFLSASGNVYDPVLDYEQALCFAAYDTKQANADTYNVSTISLILNDFSGDNPAFILMFQGPWYLCSPEVGLQVKMFYKLK